MNCDKLYYNEIERYRDRILGKYINPIIGLKMQLLSSLNKGN